MADVELVADKSSDRTTRLLAGVSIFALALGAAEPALAEPTVQAATNAQPAGESPTAPDQTAPAATTRKNPSADLVEGGIGGTVDLRTRKPFDQSGQLIAASADYNYADFRKKGFWSGNGLYSNRWGFGHGAEFGLLLAGSINNIGNRSDSIQTGLWAKRTSDPDGVPNSGDEVTGVTPSSFGIRRIDWQQKRVTFDGSAQLKPTSNLIFTVE